MFIYFIHLLLYPFVPTKCLLKKYFIGWWMVMRNGTGINGKKPQRFKFFPTLKGNFLLEMLTFSTFNKFSSRDLCPPTPSFFQKQWFWNTDLSKFGDNYCGNIPENKSCRRWKRPETKSSSRRWPNARKRNHANLFRYRQQGPEGKWHAQFSFYLSFLT